MSDPLCTHKLNQNMKYEVTTSETIVVRYISSVFVALSVRKASPPGEIWVEILITHVLFSAGTKIAHGWFSFDCLIYNHKIVVFYSFPMIRRISLSFDSKTDWGWNPRQFSIETGPKMPIFSQEPMGSPFQNIFRPGVFQSTFWLNSAYNAIFQIKIRLVQSRQQNFKIKPVLNKRPVDIEKFRSNRYNRVIRCSDIPTSILIKTSIFQPKWRSKCQDFPSKCFVTNIWSTFPLNQIII